MKKRSYKITFDLKEGYAENATEHSLTFAENAIKRWMEERLSRNIPVISGLLQAGTLLYPSVRNQQSVTLSRCAIFTGELSSKEDMRLKNKEVKIILESLACFLKEHLKQESVFITYRQKHWCL